jgi:hypothetical protein
LTYAAGLAAFLRQQDAAPAAGVAVIGIRLGRAGAPGDRLSRWRALIWKELHLQQWAIYLGAGGLVLVAVQRVLAPLATEPGSPTRIAHALLWLLVAALGISVPALVGATTVAEERRLGTLSGLRAAPVSHSAQFLLKLALAWTLALVFGLCVLLGANVDRGILFLLPSAIVLIAIHASSLSRNLIETIAVASVIGTVVVLLPFWVGERTVPPRAWILLPLVLGLLAYWNAREIVPSVRTRWLNAAVIGAAAVTYAVVFGTLARLG